MSAVPRRAVQDWFRRIFAAGAALLVLALTVLAVSPELHHWLHGDENSGGDDGCVVVQFSTGVSVANATITMAPPIALRADEARTTVREVFLVSPRYLRQPERGPPLG
ncbi:MAG: hypothetical protein RLZZ15_3868 [Verrucomicrobiota bacterium]